MSERRRLNLYGWTQPACDDCWDAAHPDKPSPRRGLGEQEQCVHCGRKTTSGIYVRLDPASQNFPTMPRRPRGEGDEGGNE